MNLFCMQILRPFCCCDSSGMKNCSSYVRKIVGKAINQHNSATISKSDRDEDRDTFDCKARQAPRQKTIIVIFMASALCNEIAHHHHWSDVCPLTPWIRGGLRRTSGGTVSRIRITYLTDRSQLQLKCPATDASRVHRINQVALVYKWANLLGANFSFSHSLCIATW